MGAATGREFSQRELLRAAERIYAVERAFLVREGITRRDDALQGKWARVPVPDGPFKGETIDPERFGRMLDEYYDLRGWDRETGCPIRKRLEELGLREIADGLEAKSPFARLEAHL